MSDPSGKNTKATTTPETVSQSHSAEEQKQQQSSKSVEMENENAKKRNEGESTAAATESENPELPELQEVHEEFVQKRVPKLKNVFDVGLNESYRVGHDGEVHEVWDKENAGDKESTGESKRKCVIS